MHIIHNALPYKWPVSFLSFFFILYSYLNCTCLCANKYYIYILVQIMAWRRPGDKPLSEPMLVSLLTHIYVTRSQWVNQIPVEIMTSMSNHIPLFYMDGKTYPCSIPMHVYLISVIKRAPEVRLCLIREVTILWGNIPKIIRCFCWVSNDRW